jgi:hypothetical protein
MVCRLMSKKEAFQSSLPPEHIPKLHNFYESLGMTSVAHGVTTNIPADAVVFSHADAPGIIDSLVNGVRSFARPALEAIVLGPEFAGVAADRQEYADNQQALQVRMDVLKKLRDLVGVSMQFPLSPLHAKAAMYKACM